METSARVVMTVVLLVGAVVATGERGAAVGEEAPVQSSSANALREAVGEWPGEKIPPPLVSRRTDGLADSMVICSSGSDAEADALLAAEGTAADTAVVGGDAEDAARVAAGAGATGEPLPPAVAPGEEAAAAAPFVAAEAASG